MEEVIIWSLVPIIVFTFNKVMNIAKDFVSKFAVNVKNKQLENALNSVDSVISDVVNYLNVTYVNDIKKASENGKLSLDEISNINKMAKDKVYKIISDESLSLVSDIVDDVDEWLDIKLERAVIENKH